MQVKEFIEKTEISNCNIGEIFKDDGDYFMIVSFTHIDNECLDEILFSTEIFAINLSTGQIEAFAETKKVELVTNPILLG